MNKRLWKFLEECGAYKRGHFVLTSGKHSDTYVEKVLALADSDARIGIAAMTLDMLNELKFAAEVVVGSPMGALSLAAELSGMSGVPYVFLEKELVMVDGKPKLDEKGKPVFDIVVRGANEELVKARNVLLVEDIVTTAGTVAQEIIALQKAGAKVGAVSVIVNRGKWTPPEGIILAALDDELPQTPLVFDEGACQLCADGVCVNTDSGHGKKWLQALSAKDLALFKKLAPPGFSA